MKAIIVFQIVNGVNMIGQIAIQYNIFDKKRNEIINEVDSFQQRRKHEDMKVVYIYMSRHTTIRKIISKLLNNNNENQHDKKKIRHMISYR